MSKNVSFVSGLSKGMNESLQKHGFMQGCVYYEELLLKHEGRAVKQANHTNLEIECDYI